MNRTEPLKLLYLDWEISLGQAKEWFSPAGLGLRGAGAWEAAIGMASWWVL